MSAPGTPVVAVVGGGVAGLAAAWRLAAGGARVVLLEATDRTGGALARGRLPGGPVVDIGAEALLARRPEAVALAREVGLGDDLVAPATTRAAVASRGALHPMPGGTVMGVPGDPRALAGLLTDAEVERALAEPLALAGPPGQADPPGQPAAGDVDVATFVGGRLGPAVVDRLVEPLLGGVYAGQASRLSVQACLPALWPAARDGTGLLEAVTGVAARSAGTAAGGAVFAGIRGGVGRLAEATAAGLVAAGADVRLRTPVTGLARRAGRWHLALAGGAELVADGVVVALPPAPAAALLAGTAPDAARDLAGVRTASLALVTLLLPPGALDAVGQALPGAPSLSGVPALSGVLVPPVEGRTVKAMTFSARKWAWVGEAAGGGDVLRLSVGRAGATEVLELADPDLLAAATADAAGLLGVALRPRSSLVTRWTDALPQYDVGHVALVERVRAAVAEHPALAVAGATYDGVGVPACLASADRAAGEALRALGLPAAR